MGISSTTGMTVKIWGARGGIPVSGPEFAEFGGDTSCVQVTCGSRHVVFDMGTGALGLGRALAKAKVKDVDIFLTHTHYDHVYALPFFVPCFDPSANLRLHVGHLLPEHTLADVITHMMTSPLFPIPKEAFRANVTYTDFTAGQAFDLGDGIQVETTPLNHPDGATGYKITYDGVSFAFLTDLEHVSDTPDPVLVEFVKGADLVAYDASYTEAEYPVKKGFGHSTWEQAVMLAEAAGVGQLMLFHNDPAHDDEAMREIESDAAKARPGTVAARQGAEFVLKRCK